MLQMNAKTVLVQSIAASLLIASGSTVAATVTKQQVVEHYADVAHAVFSDSVTTAKALDVKIDEFLKSPSAAKLDGTLRDIVGTPRASFVREY